MNDENDGTILKILIALLKANVGTADFIHVAPELISGMLITMGKTDSEIKNIMTAFSETVVTLTPILRKTLEESDNSENDIAV